MKKIRFAAMLAAAALLLFASCGKDENEGSTTPSRYTVTVEPNIPEFGSALGSGSYADGTNVTIEAAPKTGFYFIRWSDGAQSNPRTITVSSNVKLYALFSSTENDPNPYNPAEGGPAPTPETNSWVDLGLPSGLLWASCNVGASKPEEFGNYYAWGETTTKSTYTWETYLHCEGDMNHLTKYCDDGSFGSVDHLIRLREEDDVAAQVMGNGARIPSREEWEELIDNTSMFLTQMNNVDGVKFVSSNGNYIFLPSAGYRSGDDLRYAGESGYYWSASLREGASTWMAYMFVIHSAYQEVGQDGREAGRSVRAVREK